MKLSDYRDAYYQASSKASEVARHLAFAGIAVIWIFKISDGSKIILPNEFFLPLVFFCLALAFDLLHYVASTIIWGWFCRYNEKKLKDVTVDPRLSASRYLNWPINFFFGVKLVFVAIAYATLIRQLGILWLG